MGTNCGCCKPTNIRVPVHQKINPPDINGTNKNPQPQKEINNDAGLNKNGQNDIKIKDNVKGQLIQTYKKYNLKKTNKYSDNITFLLELNNKKLMTGSSNGTIAIYNLDNFELEYSIKEENKILCLLEFEPNMILTGTQSELINLYNISQNKKIDSFKGHLLSVNCLVKLNAKYFASASNDKDIRIWNYYNRSCERTLKGHNNNIFCLIQLNNKSQICSGSADKTAKLWEWETGKYLGTLPHQSWVKSLCQLSDGSIITGGDDKIIKIWLNYKELKTFNEHKDSVKCLCNIDNRYIASGSFDNTIKIWDLTKNKCIQTITEHSDKVVCLLNHSKGYLISCSNDKTIKFWKLD